MLLKSFRPIDCRYSREASWRRMLILQPPVKKLVEVGIPEVSYMSEDWLQMGIIQILLKKNSWTSFPIETEARIVT
jgi:hypothetical protein